MNTNYSNTATHRPRPHPLYYFIACIVGLLTGVLGAVFRELVDHSSSWFSHLPRILGLEGMAQYVVMGVLSAAFLCAALALVRWFAPEASGSGVQEIEGAMKGERRVRWVRIIPVKFIGGFLTLTGGLIGGREGPTIHMGASIAQAIGSRFRFPVDEFRALLGAGGAAGLTAAFNAPIASVIFILEEARDDFPFKLRNYSAAILACGFSAVSAGLIAGTGPLMPLSSTAVPLEFLPAFAVLGIIFGVLGVLFNRGVMAGLDIAQTIGLRLSPYLVPALLGFIIGPLLVSLPEAVGGGELFVVAVVNNPLPIALLGLVALLRFFGTVASYSAGTPAGIFAPILSLATTVSVLLGSILELFMEVPPGTMAAFAVAGMAGLFSSTVRAPLVGMVLVAELTGTYGLALPVLITAIVSSIVGGMLGARPIYEQLLERTLRLNPGGVSIKASAPAGEPVSS